ncbi:MotA/TolQ/ExbB proton channel family protein [Aliiruegeria lutimaris]|nr:MotA/TolQ/ExbB proton channel family protein [Aliiruegeria lutimaris]
MEQMISTLTRGGPVIGVLAVLSLISVTLIVVKLLDMRGALGGQSGRDAAYEAWRKGERASALKTVEAGKSPLDRILSAAMSGLIAGRRRTALTEELEWRGNQELDRLSRHIRTLELVGMVSPLLGLLGTVLGMISSFQELALAEGAANASLLAGGIWQALLTTAAGLVVAIPSAVSASLLGTRVDRIGVAMETAVGRLMTLEDADGEAAEEA